MSNANKTKSKIELLMARLSRPSGATLDELMKTTGWQAHSVRAAMAGTLRKKGMVVTSEKVDSVRRYRVTEPTNR